MNDGLLKPAVIPDKLRNNLETISGMPMDDMKRLFMELIDKNRLYVNLCDMDDEEMNVKPEDKAFSKNFYQM